MNELERVQQNIETLLESNKLGWIEIADELDSQRRIALKRALFDRTDELLELLNRRDELRGPQND